MRKLLLGLLILLLPIAVGAGTIEYLPPGGVNSLGDLGDLGCSDANPLLHWDDGGSEWLCQPDAQGAGGGDAITLNDAAFTATDADFDDDLPLAPAGGVNVLWQGVGASPSNISAYVPLSGVQGVGLVVTGSVLDLDLTEINDETWGTGGQGTITLTFALSGGNSVLVIDEDYFSFDDDVLILGGNSLHLFESDSTQSVALIPPATIASNRTCQLVDGAAFIPDSCVGDGSDGGITSVTWIRMSLPPRSLSARPTC
jgi:hypothetical protein